MCVCELPEEANAKLQSAGIRSIRKALSGAPCSISGRWAQGRSIVHESVRVFPSRDGGEVGIVAHVECVKGERSVESLCDCEILCSSKIHPNDLIDIQTPDRLERNSIAETETRITIQRACESRRTDAGWGGCDLNGRGRGWRGLERSQRRKLPTIHDISGEPG